MGRGWQCLTPCVETTFQRRRKHLAVPSPKTRADVRKGRSLSELMSLVRGRAKIGGVVLRQCPSVEAPGETERRQSGQRWHSLLLELFVQVPQEQSGGGGYQLRGAQAQSRSAWRDNGFFEGCCLITEFHDNFYVYSIAYLSCFLWKHSIKLQ